MQTPGALFGKLPVELLDMTADLVEGTMSREEADAYRLELMKERTVFVDQSDSEFFGQVSDLAPLSIDEVLTLNSGVQHVVCSLVPNLPLHV